MVVMRFTEFLQCRTQTHPTHNTTTNHFNHHTMSPLYHLDTLQP